ncbi:MAG: peptidase dimerization domain-containing protein, partial [Nocardioides sp.]
RRVGVGMPTPQRSDLTDAMLDVLLTEPWTDATAALAQAGSLHPTLEHLLPALVGTTMAPTMLGASTKRNVMPSRAHVELDCRILPGTTEADVEREVRARLGDDVRYSLEWPEPLIAGSSSPPEGAVMSAITAYLADVDPDVVLLPVLDTGFTDSVYLRAAGGTAAYGFNPMWHTPAAVVDAGYHNADERVHVDDLLASVEFHLDLAHRLLG